MLIIGLIIFTASYATYFIFSSTQNEILLSLIGFGLLGGLLISLIGYFLFMFRRIKAANAVSPEAGRKKPRWGKTWFIYGLILMLSGFVVNTSFMLLNIVGYLRELTRLTTIVGLVILFIGCVQLIANFVRIFKRNMVKK